ncbi:MAG: site-2 protease family protein [Clostridia bacterium]|nr:site-2 protease family protein [Clostridia bacterium]
MISGLFSDFTGTLITLLLSLPGVVLAVSFHESAHGLIAWKLGDDTAKLSGRISLNPLRHVDPIGLLVLLFFRVGWARPVQVNVRKLKHPKRDMCLVALAGPAANLLLSLPLAAAAFALAYFYGVNYARFGDTTFSTVLEVLTNVFEYAAAINVGLGIFNLIPIPPLDGWKVLGSFLPVKVYFTLMRFERFGMILLIALLMTGLLSTPLNLASNAILNLEYEAIARLASLFI